MLRSKPPAGRTESWTQCLLAAPVNCDRGRIAQLFGNLLSNALTYGAVDEPILVRAFSGAGRFELVVANAGEPIPPVDLKRLFQPFFPSETATFREGLGLGLYLASEIAIAHGGTLEVQSSDRETRFTFRMQA